MFYCAKYCSKYIKYTSELKFQKILKIVKIGLPVDLLKFFLWTIIQNNYYVYPKIKNIEKWIH